MWSRRSLSTYRAELGPPLRGDSINFTGEIFISFLSSDSPEKNDPATARLTPAFILLRLLLPRSHLSRNWSNADSKKFSILLVPRGRLELEKFRIQLRRRRRQSWVEAGSRERNSNYVVRTLDERAGWRGKRREEEFDDKVENLMDFTKAGGF